MILPPSWDAGLPQVVPNEEVLPGDEALMLPVDPPPARGGAAG